MTERLLDLDDPPSEAELRATPTALSLEQWDITRMSEPFARELGLANVIQRPRVLTDDRRAWVARDDETLTEVAAGRRPVEGP
jgi:arsenate reductase